MPTMLGQHVVLTETSAGVNYGCKCCWNGSVWRFLNVKRLMKNEWSAKGLRLVLVGNVVVSGARIRCG